MTCEENVDPPAPNQNLLIIWFEIPIYFLYFFSYFKMNINGGEGVSVG